MDAFGLGPLPHGWECKMEPKTGRIYFINHRAKATTWDDPRLNAIPPPPYHIAVNQPTAYFEDAAGSRWSSPVPSLRGFSLNRRGSSPRLGGSPRIAPSPTLPPKNLRNEQQQLILEGISHSTTTSPVPKPRSSLSNIPSSSTAASSSTATTSKSTSGGPPYVLKQPTPYPPSPQPPTYHQHQQEQKQQLLTQRKLQHHHHQDGYHDDRSSSPQPGTSAAHLVTAKITSIHVDDMPLLVERPQSARSYASSSYSGVPASFLSNCDADTAFRTVCTLFPTAGEPHIRHLFHKYHNRATLVVSALQVEKHPVVNDIATQLHISEISPKRDGEGDTDTIASINADSKSIGISSPYKVNSYTTGSPARTGTPISLLKFPSNNQSSVGSLHTTRWGSPMLSMSPHPQLQMVREEAKQSTFQSPKMKLKYLKGIFPAADETFLLDVLSSCENNVQKASEKMLRKGFTKTPPPKPARQKWLEVKNLIEKRQRQIDQQNICLALESMASSTTAGTESPFPTPIMKPARPHMSVQTKLEIKARLMNKFRNLPERFIEWALEAATYEQEKCEKLLSEVGPQTPDEFKPFVVANNAAAAVPAEQQRRIRFADGLTTTTEFESGLPLLSSSSGQDGITGGNMLTAGFSDGDLVDTPDSGYFELDMKSRKKNFISSLFGIKYEKDKPFVPSSQNAKGANSALARGPNPSFVQSSYLPTLGPSTNSKGPNPKLRQGAVGSSQGPNPSLAKGSVWGRKGHPSNRESVTMHHVAVEG